MNQKNDEKFQKSLKNLIKATNVLRDNLKKKDFSDLERSGVIQNFEVVFELIWKTIQKRADLQGRTVGGAKDAFILAFEWGFIADEDIWFRMIQDRNLTVHTYNEIVAKELLERLKTLYQPAFQGLLDAMKNS